jgi:hypothetical protein
LLHNIFDFEISIIVCAVLAILGYLRAKLMYKKDQQQPELASYENEELEETQNIII